MSWLWRSSTPQSTGTAEQAGSIPQAPTTSFIEPVSDSQSAAAASPNTPEGLLQPPRQLSRDEQAEAEFRELLRELDQPPTSLSTLPADSAQARTSSSSRFLQPPEDSIHPTALYPRSLSCRAAFDAAFYCQSMGGQFTNVYRHGSARNCSETWSNFWFCMRTNRSGYSEDEKIDRIRKHYWEREEKYRKGPSSEEVWRMRDKRVEGAFEGDYEAMEREEAERMD